MNNAIAELSAAELTRAIEENLFGLIPAFRRWPRATVHEDASLRWSMTDYPVPLFNSIFAARLGDQDVDAAIRSTVERASAAGLPVLWWTGPSTRPVDLGERLLGHGFIPVGDLPGMALALDDSDHEASLPPGFSVRRVTDDTELTTWSEVAAAAFEMPPVAGSASHDFMRHVDAQTTRAYVGWLNGTPVATSVAMFAADAVGIYNVATLPAARRLGIGRAMTAIPLNEARAEGCRVAILHATDMAESLYRQMGFREHCRIGQYLWMPASANAETHA